MDDFLGGLGISGSSDEDDDDDEDIMSEIESRLGLPFEDFEKLLSEVLTKKPLFYKKLHQDAVDPKYAYETDSGFDLHSAEEIHFLPFERKLVPTGLSFDIPEGFEIQVRTKSGLAIKQGLMVLNSQYRIILCIDYTRVIYQISVA